MKSLILFYSYSGKTKAIAQELAIRERGKTWPIQPLDVDLTTYDRLITAGNDNQNQKRNLGEL